MYLYQMHEAEFILPQPAQDQSLHVFAFHDPMQVPKPGQKPEFSFVVSRELLKAEQTLFAYAAEQQKSMPERLNKYQLLRQEDIVLDGLPAILCEFRWKSDYGEMRQWQVYIISPTSGASDTDARTVLSLTGTCLESLYQKHEFLFQQLIYSFTFRR